MRVIIDCFSFLWNCVGGGGGGGGTNPVPEINGPGSVAAIALVLSVGAVVYRRYVSEQPRRAEKI